MSYSFAEIKARSGVLKLTSYAVCSGFVDLPRYSYEHSNASFQLLLFHHGQSVQYSVAPQVSQEGEARAYVVEKTNTKAANTNTIDE